MSTTTGPTEGDTIRLYHRPSPAGFPVPADDVLVLLVDGDAATVADEDGCEFTVDLAVEDWEAV